MFIHIGIATCVRDDDKVRAIVTVAIAAAVAAAAAHKLCLIKVYASTQFK